MNNEKLNSIVDKVNSVFAWPAFVALKNGASRIVTISLVGSIFILLQSFPITGWSNIMSSIFGELWKTPVDQVVAATSDLIALVMVFSIAYEYGVQKIKDAFSCSIVAISCFLILIPGTVTSGDVTVSSAIAKSWLGGSGSVTAIVVALVSAKVYCWVVNKGWEIKLPDQVPAGVARAFSAIIPSGICIILAFLACYGIQQTAGITVAEGLYKLLQLPLQGITGSLPGYIIISLLMSTVWFFGIHSSVIGSIFNPFLAANRLANKAIVDAGLELTVANGAYIITSQYNRTFMALGGSGATFGLALALFFLSKSKRYKTLGKVAIVPSIFTINEPLIFGFPIAYNPIMLIPFVLAPIACILTGYFAMKIGFCGLFAGVTVPWTTPPLICAFILGGWRLTVVQAICIVESFLIYYPFFKKFDNQALKEEAEEEAALAEK